MGIRVTCPNGHALNLKAQLAGKRGICPHCGAKFDIPPVEAELGPPGEAEEVAGATVEADPAPNAPARQPPASPVPRSEPTAPMPAAGGQGWFLRNPTGETYGPAPPEQLDRWLAEGRVAADAWVWSAPWSEWRQAADVFPDRVVRGPAVGQAPATTAGMAGLALNEAGTPPANLSGDDDPLKIELALDHAVGKSVVRARRRRSEALLGTLALLTLLLAGVLVWILVR